MKIQDAIGWPWDLKDQYNLRQWRMLKPMFKFITQAQKGKKWKQDILLTKDNNKHIHILQKQSLQQMLNSMRILHNYNKELNNKFISHSLISSSYTRVISHLIYKTISFIKDTNLNINMVQVLSTNNSKDFNLWFINNRFNPFNK